MISEGELLWAPSAERVESANITVFSKWLQKKRGLNFVGDYEALRQWSVAHYEDFWADCWEFFGIVSDTPYERVIDRPAMPGAKWFEGSRVNFAEHMLHRGSDDDIAFAHLSETRPLAYMTRGELRRAVRAVASELRRLGIVPGDRVVLYMPNIVETAVAFMASVAVGAICSSAPPEFGVQTVLDRFSQIAPKLLFAADGYCFGGKHFDRREEVQKLVAGLPTLEHVVWMPYLDEQAVCPVAGAVLLPDMLKAADPGKDAFAFERVAYDHPLWIVYSSGTTGLPKPIVHSHVGALLELSVTIGFHCNMGPGKRMFFYTTTGWVMWNLVLSALLTGASSVLFDGHPAAPAPDRLWQLAEEAGVTMFGASPTFVQLMEKAGIKPRASYNLEKLESVLLGGSPATPETFAWFYRDVKEDLWVTSQSGGTDIASGFVGASPTLPVYAGEIQCRMLARDVQAWSDDGKPVINEVGELVCVNPIPSMPIGFWNDTAGERYRESYFDYFPGYWRHGDFIKINERGGCYIYGRSDSTLNRYGVRIGTAEIYRTVERVEGVADSLIVCCELPDGGFFMPLFVKLKENVPLDAALIARINSALREHCSPRHVPDAILEVAAVPYTLTGKKMEVPVRKILMGWSPEKAANRDAMANPAALDFFIRFAAEGKDDRWQEVLRKARAAAA
ncbi:acetoacetate--CoA ligase [Paraburkholderia denitrificans]|uniref:Acetoacetate--CoA ligase n=1 Tax=Paraburkholderia denitrificans TaxID=694025 RepID=A0ABW0JCK7_9BURK